MNAPAWCGLHTGYRIPMPSLFSSSTSRKLVGSGLLARGAEPPTALPRHRLDGQPSKWNRHGAAEIISHGHGNVTFHGSRHEKDSRSKQWRRLAVRCAPLAVPLCKPSDRNRGVIAARVLAKSGRSRCLGAHS